MFRTVRVRCFLNVTDGLVSVHSIKREMKAPLRSAENNQRGGETDWNVYQPELEGCH